MDTLRIRRLTETAILPQRAEPGSVGYDLAADTLGGSITIWAGGRETISTGVAVAIPPGMYGRVAPRSGLAVKYGIDVLAGVIDPSYRGEIRVVLHNTGSKPFKVEQGMRIAQLILELCEVLPVEEVASLDETVRGANGFGSTGMRVVGGMGSGHSVFE